MLKASGRGEGGLVDGWSGWVLDGEIYQNLITRLTRYSHIVVKLIYMQICTKAVGD